LFILYLIFISICVKYYVNWYIKKFGHGQRFYKFTFTSNGNNMSSIFAKLSHFFR